MILINYKQMAKILNVAQQTISDRLKLMAKIQNSGKWMPLELADGKLQTTCEILFHRHDRSHFTLVHYWQQ